MVRIRVTCFKNNDNNDIYIKCDQYWNQAIRPKEIAAFSLEKI